MTVLKKHKGSVVLTVFLVLVTIVGAIVLSINTNRYLDVLDAQSQEITNLETQVKLAKANYDANANNIIQSVTGIDVSRKHQDDEAAAKLFELVHTWTGSEEFNKMKEEVMVKYGLYSSDPFIHEFLGSSGVTSDMPSAYKDMRSICYHMDEDTGLYSYIAWVDAQTQSGSASASVTYVYMYTVNESGDLSGISAFTLAN